jgi:hypothetical protein
VIFGISIDMPAKTYIKIDGAWQPVKLPAPFAGGARRLSKKVWVKDGGVWRLVYGTEPATQSFTTPGTTSFIVPDGIYSISVQGCGGGGQGGNGDGGANNDGSGGGGGGSNLITNTYSVMPGTVLSVTVGRGGSENLGDGENGLASTVTGTGVSFSAAGGEGGGGRGGWNDGTGARVGLGANGANYPNYNTFSSNGGTSTNGGANGGNGGPYSRGDSLARVGSPGQNGKINITY